MVLPFYLLSEHSAGAVTFGKISSFCYVTSITG